MGNWSINVQGTGAHHNGKPEIDADLAAIEFVETLRKQGQLIESASFTSGKTLDLTEEHIVEPKELPPTHSYSVPPQ